MPSGSDAQPRESERRLEIARMVATSWSDAAMRWGSLPMEGRVCAHPLACVLAALDGETDPVELGIGAEDAMFEAIQKAARE
jgi:hypothetical protein